jgi:hypothetical protein
MAVTGIHAVTLAFLLSDGTCNAKWDGTRALLGGSDQAAIDSIRAAGGDVVVSFGGWSGRKLGIECHSARALARAFEAVIDAYTLKAFDLDIEHTEIASAAARGRIVGALKIVKRNHPDVQVSITFGTGQTGPFAVGLDLIDRAASASLAVDAWTIMPFDFGAPVSDMGQVSVQAAEGLKSDLMTAYQESAAAAYATMGISSMNGQTDEADETVTIQNFKTILAYAQAHHLARLTFWSVNRDRSCGAGGGSDSCSGVSQRPFAFTKIIARYHG